MIKAKNGEVTFRGTKNNIIAEAVTVLHALKEELSEEEYKMVIMKCFADNADRLSREADTEGITGFMYGCAVSILSQCWEYGEYLRKWHNKEYDYDGKGVVNPALMRTSK